MITLYRIWNFRLSVILVKAFSYILTECKINSLIVAVVWKHRLCICNLEKFSWKAKNFLKFEFLCWHVNQCVKNSSLLEIFKYSQYCFIVVYRRINFFMHLFAFFENFFNLNLQNFHTRTMIFTYLVTSLLFESIHQGNNRDNGWILNLNNLQRYFGIFLWSRFLLSHHYLTNEQIKFSDDQLKTHLKLQTQ